MPARSPANKATRRALDIWRGSPIEKRGRLDEQDTEEFLAAGSSRELLLEVITIVAASTITN